MVTAEMHAILCDFHERFALCKAALRSGFLTRENIRDLPYPVLHGGAEGKYLEATRVGEDGAVPVHELMQPAVLRHELGPGAEIQMIRVAKNKLRASRLCLLGRKRFNRALRADGNERGRLHLAMRGAEHSRASLLIGGGNFETKYCITHTRIVPGAPFSLRAVQRNEGRGNRFLIYIFIFVWCDGKQESVTRSDCPCDAITERRFAMKKTIGLILVSLLLAACSEGPTQGFFLDLREHRSYSTAKVTFTCTNDSADDITKSFDLGTAAWVVQLDDMRSQLVKECDAAILPSKVTDLDDVDFDDVVGAYFRSVTLSGDGKDNLVVEPYLPGAPEAKDITFFASRGSGGGNFQPENPDKVRVNRVVIGKGWGIYTFVPYKSTGEELKIVDLNDVKWVAAGN